MEREQRRVRDARHEGARVLSQSARAAARDFAAGGQPQALAGRRFRGRRRQRTLAGVFDEGAAALAGGEIALGDQPVVSQGDRNARNPELFSQRSRGRQPLPGDQGVVEHAAAHDLVDLPLQGELGFPREGPGQEIREEHFFHQVALEHWHLWLYKI
ncbi:hypothetical protein G6F50_016245 [Rhizopus delemar]|uniref:Uncharacterized protein n=1 Tax=Rhizopus delemar TaxID=936053 RepID=A0A9P7C2L8_9FUNG|nr:hypothetical protein G6F50_016245 [Rhizopus delemar]